MQKPIPKSLLKEIRLEELHQERPNDCNDCTKYTPYEATNMYGHCSHLNCIVSCMQAVNFCYNGVRKC